MNARQLAIIALMVIVIASALGYYVLQSMSERAPPAAHVYKPGFNVSVTGMGVADYDLYGNRTAYFTYSASVEDVSSVSVEAMGYNDSIPEDIYFLDHECDGYGCQEAVARFYASLDRNLREKGVLSENTALPKIKINQLSRITEPTIVIVPTGRIPSDMMDPSSDSSVSVLTQTGSVIIYIGSDFSFSITREGAVHAVSQEAREMQSLSFREVRGRGTSTPYRMKQTEFRLSNLSVRAVANEISAIKMGPGYFVAFPSSVSVGWGPSGETIAGEDVAEFIQVADWQPQISAKNSTANLTERGNRFPETVFLSPAPYASKHVRAYFEFNATTGPSPGNYSIKRGHYDIEPELTPNGRMFHPVFGVNDSTIPLRLNLNESFPEETQVFLYLDAFKDGAKVQEQYLGSVTFSGAYDTRMNYHVNLSGGDHLLRVRDYTGKAYAESMLHIPEVSLKLLSAAQDLSEFQFKLISDSIPVQNTVVFTSIDGRDRMQSITGADGRFSYKPATQPGFGNHTVTVEATGKAMRVTAERKAPPNPIFDDPKNVVIIGATLIVFLLGIALQRSEPSKYSIDVPDFPPQKKERVLISKYALINLIDSTNSDYRWKNMPLSLAEIKNGVKKKIRHQGKPIMVSDYNLEKLLTQLVASGHLFQAQGMYGLSSWLKQSGKTPRYLATFRAMRNFFINNAILFTEIGQRQDCDTLANYRGENIYLHIYESEETANRAIATAAKGTTFIIFPGREEMDAFERKLSTSATPLSVALKMQIDFGRLELITTSTLGAIIGRTG